MAEDLPSTTRSSKLQASETVVEKLGIFRRFGRFYMRNEFLFIFGFSFISLHIIWFNMQRQVPMEDRSEVKALNALKTLWNKKPEDMQPKDAK